MTDQEIMTALAPYLDKLEADVASITEHFIKTNPIVFSFITGPGHDLFDAETDDYETSIQNVIDNYVQSVMSGSGQQDSDNPQGRRVLKASWTDMFCRDIWKLLVATFQEAGLSLEDPAVEEYADTLYFDELLSIPFWVWAESADAKKEWESERDRQLDVASRPSGYWKYRGAQPFLHHDLDDLKDLETVTCPDCHGHGASTGDLRYDGKCSTCGGVGEVIPGDGSYINLVDGDEAYY